LILVLSAWSGDSGARWLTAVGADAGLPLRTQRGTLCGAMESASGCVAFAAADGEWWCSSRVRKDTGVRGRAMVDAFGRGRRGRWWVLAAGLLVEALACTSVGFS